MCRFGEILKYALTLCEHFAKVVLSFSIAFLGHGSKVYLRLRMALYSGIVKKTCGNLIIMYHTIP